jgi:hypothetical protein
MKEPNGVLVMTTCKCRENNQNLVMTRQYLNDLLQNKSDSASRAERDRVKRLLQDRMLPDILSRINPAVTDYNTLLKLLVDLVDDDLEVGNCDTCNAVYELASRAGRCGDCGNCAEHCDHVNAGKAANNA